MRLVSRLTLDQKMTLRNLTWLTAFSYVTTVVDKKLNGQLISVKRKYMKAPRQWIKTWPKEDLKKLELVECLCMLQQS